MDPQWLYQAYEDDLVVYVPDHCGCLLVRDGTALRRAFEIVPEYLLDVVPGEEEVNFGDLGLQRDEPPPADQASQCVTELRPAPGEQVS